MATPAKEVNEFHQKSDVDTSFRAQHHTLGGDANQASPGNHTHDGTTSPAIDTGVMTITSIDETVDITGPTAEGVVDLSVPGVLGGSYEDDDFVTLAGSGTVVHTLTHLPVAETLNVYWNGVRLQTNEFTRINDEVTITDPDSRFDAGDEIWFWYKYAGTLSGEHVESVTSISPEIDVDNTDPLNPIISFDAAITYELREQEDAFTDPDAPDLPPLYIRRNPITGRVYLGRVS